MSVAIADIRTLVRYILGDFSRTMIPGDIFTYTTATIFTLSEPNAISIVKVLHNNAELADSGTYTYDSDTNKIEIITDLIAGDSIEVQYTYYPNYSITELDNYINSAIIYLSTNNYYNFVIESDAVHPEPTTAETRLIALVTATLIEPPMQSLRLPDLSLNFPRELNKDDKISKIIAIAKKNVHGDFENL